MIWLNLSPVWGWLGLGLALMAIEVLVAPGSYLLWVGLAALAMAALSAVMSFGAALELTVFGALAVLSGMIGWLVYGRRAAGDSAQDLHDPSRTMLGQVVIIATAIENGVGQARVGDSVWRVTGPDLPVGAQARIRAVDGATLLVEPA